jgi:hypothetical protein
MESKNFIKLEQERPIEEIGDINNKYFDMDSYLQLKDMLKNLNSSNLRLFEKILEKFKDKKEEEKEVNLFIRYYFFQIYNYLKKEENIKETVNYSLYYTFKCLLQVILDYNLLSFFKISEFDINNEINEFSKIIDLLDEKTKTEKKKNQNRRERAKRKKRVNAFRIACGLPTGSEINEFNEKQREFRKITGLDIIDKEKNKFYFKNTTKHKIYNQGRTNKYYDSDDEVEFIEPELYGGMIHPLGLPSEEELRVFLGKKNKNKI